MSTLTDACPNSRCVPLRRGDTRPGSAAVGVDRVDAVLAVAVADERDLAIVWRPRVEAVDRATGRVRQLLHACAVAVHHVDVRRAGRAEARLRERNPRAFGRAVDLVCEPTQSRDPLEMLRSAADLSDEDRLESVCAAERGEHRHVLSVREDTWAAPAPGNPGEAWCAAAWRHDRPLEAVENEQVLSVREPRDLVPKVRTELVQSGTVSVHCVETLLPAAPLALERDPGPVRRP
jgi:hypothetical protein